MDHGISDISGHLPRNGWTSVTKYNFTLNIHCNLQLSRAFCNGLIFPDVAGFSRVLSNKPAYEQRDGCFRAVRQ